MTSSADDVLSRIIKTGCVEFTIRSYSKMFGKISATSSNFCTETLGDFHVAKVFREELEACAGGVIRISCITHDSSRLLRVRKRGTGFEIIA